MSKFQLIFMALFIVFAFAGVAIFAAFQGKTGENIVLTPMTIWGVVDETIMNEALGNFSQKKTLGAQYELTYVRISETDFDSVLAQGIATGKGPDIVLFPHDLKVKISNKLRILPLESYPVRTYKDSFIEEAEIFLEPNGIIAFPLVVDPLVMYWNRDIFTNAAIATPPSTWEEFLSVVPALTKKDVNLNITQSGVALGTFDNVSHAKEIISTLLLQGGSPVVSVGPNGFRGGIGGSLSDGGQTQKGEAVLNFYTQFSNPLSSTYSWNKSLPMSFNYFTEGGLALYFGFASEMPAIRQKNPNLNFDVAAFPQPKNTTKKLTFGTLYSLGVLNSSPNAIQAFQVAAALSSSAAVAELSDRLGLPPARRDLLAKASTDPYKTLFNVSALRSVGWLDPEPRSSNFVFRTMVESLVSGQFRTYEAIRNADMEMELLFLNSSQ